MNEILRTAVVVFILMGCLIQLRAKEADSVSLRPSFELEYTAELQTDFKRTRQVNLLQLCAKLPLSRRVSFKVSSLSIASTTEEALAADLQVYSNIDALNQPFMLSVAGFSWQINDCHSLFAGIRSIDEDYFCSDVLSLFTNSSCGGFPTISISYPIAIYPVASMGIHYQYDNENLGIQASLYNGIGYNRFTGPDNVFRFCPKSDGLFALGQVEYRYQSSSYFLGASLYKGELWGEDEHQYHPTIWTYAEQALSDRLKLIAAYSHAFCSDELCRDFYGIGGKYAYKKIELGVFSDYTSVFDIDEWATELTCNITYNDHLSIQPVLHVLKTDGETKYIGMLRLNVTL